MSEWNIQNAAEYRITYNKSNVVKIVLPLAASQIHWIILIRAKKNVSCLSIFSYK